MSGSDGGSAPGAEVEPGNIVNVDIPAHLLDEYGKSGGDISNLQGLTQRKDTGGYISQYGTDVSDRYKLFRDWVGSRDAGAKKYEEYLSRKQARPGRDATILTPMSTPEQKALLGEAPTKTLLGNS